MALPSCWVCRASTAQRPAGLLHQRSAIERSAPLQLDAARWSRDSPELPSARKAELTPANQTPGEVRHAREPRLAEDGGTHRRALAGLTDQHHGSAGGDLVHPGPELVQRNQHRALHVPELAIEFRARANVHHLDLAQVVREPRRIDLRDTGVGLDDRAPSCWRRRAPRSPPAGSHVRRNGHREQLRVRQAEVLHVADEVLQLRSTTQAGVVPTLLGDRARETSLVVVAWMDHALLGEGEELGVDRLEQLRGIPLLKVGATHGADQERVTSEDMAAVRADEGEAAGGVARSRPDLE